MKDFIQWNHERGTWQYDIFCLLIVAFIFLTPKTWFEKRERLATQTTQRVVKADDFTLEKAEMQWRVNEISGNENAAGEDFYEIEIR